MWKERKTNVFNEALKPVDKIDWRVDIRVKEFLRHSRVKDVPLHCTRNLCANKL